MNEVACFRCCNTGWVCEAHDNRPWDGPHACGCGAAGAPCPSCNVSDPDNPPRLPAGLDAMKASMTEMGSLILQRASVSRSSGQWRDDDYDVLENGVVVGRIFCLDAVGPLDVGERSQRGHQTCGTR